MFDAVKKSVQLSSLHGAARPGLLYRFSHACLAHGREADSGAQCGMLYSVFPIACSVSLCVMYLVVSKGCIFPSERTGGKGSGACGAPLASRSGAEGSLNMLEILGRCAIEGCTVQHP